MLVRRRDGAMNMEQSQTAAESINYGEKYKPAREVCVIKKDGSLIFNEENKIQSFISTTLCCVKCSYENHNHFKQQVTSLIT